MKNLFQKFGLKILFAMFVSGMTEKLKDKNLTENQEEALDVLKETGQDVVQALTDDNPQDKEQLIAVYEDHKHEIGEAALDLLEDEIKCKFADHPDKLFVGQVAAQALRDLLNLPEDEIATAIISLPIIGEENEVPTEVNTVPTQVNTVPTQEEARTTAPTYFDKNKIA